MNCQIQQYSEKKFQTEKNTSAAPRRLKAVLAGVVLTLMLVSANPAAANTRPPDAWITAKAKLTLWTTGGVRSTDVSIDTVKGNVTMYGTVESAAQKQKVYDLVKGIDGVKSVRDLLQVVKARDAKVVAEVDSKIKTKVEQALKAEKSLADSDINVRSVDKGAVLLGGKAKSMSDHLNAILTADSVEGVRQVSSQIEAPERFTAAEIERIDSANQNKGAGLASAAGDMAITTQIKLRYFAGSEIPALDINVDTHRGRVSLFGMVSTDGERSKAEQVALSTNGVKSVANYLQVVPKNEQKAVKAEDKDIKNEITKALHDDADFKNVDVLVTNGTIRLTGSVPSSWDSLYASVVSRSTPGARSVQNELKVGK